MAQNIRQYAKEHFFMTQYILNYADYLSDLKQANYKDTNDYVEIDNILNALIEKNQTKSFGSSDIFNFIPDLFNNKEKIFKSSEKIEKILDDLAHLNNIEKQNSTFKKYSIEEPAEFKINNAEQIKLYISDNQYIDLSGIPSNLINTDEKIRGDMPLSHFLINLDDIDKIPDISDIEEEKIEENNALKLPWISSEAIMELQDGIKENSKAERNELVYSYLKKLQRFKPIVEIKDFTIFNSMLEKAPNFSEVLNHFKGNFILNQARRESEEVYFAPKPILLLGDPGIGKTYFAKLLAKSLQTSFHFIDSNSITGSWILSGSGGVWKNSDAGLIFKNMLSSNTISPLIIFDEIDKLSEGKNHDPFSTFHQLLEPENAKTFKDEFLNVSFDASNIIYILTANNANNIPESLLSRMKVFNVPNLTPEQTRLVAQNMYTDIIGNTTIFNKALNSEALEQLENLSPRRIKQVLEDVVYSQVAQLSSLKDEINLTINIKKIKKSMGFSKS